MNCCRISFVIVAVVPGLFFSMLSPVVAQGLSLNGDAQPGALQASDLSTENCGQDDKPERLTERSFLFTWPCQDCDDLKLNLCDPLVTDRPDFTEASSTVGRGITQIEIGYTYTTDEELGVRTDSHSYPEVLIRTGLLRDWFELRVGYNAGVVADGASRISGSDDLYLGAKIGLTPQHGLLPEMAIIPQATLATGSDDFTTGEDLFGVNWVYSWELSDRVGLAGSTQFNRAIDGVSANDYTQWAQSATVGVGLTDCLSTYVEWFAFFPDNADTDPVEHYLNGGFARVINRNIQWDVRAGLGLNDFRPGFLCRYRAVNQIPVNTVCLGVC